MTKNEFKQGDKVKLKEYREFTCGNQLTYIDTDEIGVIEQIEADWLKVNFPDMPTLLDLGWSDVVPAEPQEIKTAFLTELQALLRKYDAFFSVDAEGSYCGNDVEKVEFSIFIGEDRMIRDVTEDCIIDADDIMDFNKD